MTVFDVVRSAMLAGFGLQEKARELIDDLVKRGELSNSQGSKLLKEWAEKADKSTEELSKTLSLVVERAVSSMNLATKSDIEKLNKKLQTISGRVKKLEGEGDDTSV